MASSSYTDCACRDCFEVAISSDQHPALCHDCADAGCSAKGDAECAAAQTTQRLGVNPDGTYAGFVRRGNNWSQFCVTSGAEAVRMLARSNDPSSIKFEVLS